MTVQDILYDARALIDEYNVNGVVISNDNITTLQTSGIRFCDMAQKELFKEIKYFNTVEFANKPAPNLLGTLSNFEIVDFIGEDKSYPDDGVVGAKAYFFEVDNDATVYIEENNGSWVTLSTITVTGITELTGYKGLITPSSDSNPIRIRFSGSTFYHHKNRCLFSYPFKSTVIPDYRPWVKKTMPSDFAELDQIIDEHPTRQYSKDPNYKWEGFNELYMNYYYEGNIRVIYKIQPTTLTALTDTLQVNSPTAISAITHYVAYLWATTEVADLVNTFLQRYQELKFESKGLQPSGEEAIENVYSGWVYG